jgi:predicted nucleic acid-binding protein
MKPILADTSYFVAVCGPSDQFHTLAVELSANLLSGIITTEYVLVETGGLLLRPEDRPAFVNLVRDLESDPAVTIVAASKALFQAGFDLFTRRPDKKWSLVDCISFVVMKQRRLKEALTTDQHFQQAGFRALLREEGSAYTRDVPKLFDHADKVRSLTQGRAGSSMEPFAYRPAPDDLLRSFTDPEY